MARSSSSPRKEFIKAQIKVRDEEHLYMGMTPYLIDRYLEHLDASRNLAKPES